MAGIVGMKSGKKFDLPAWSVDFIDRIDLRSALGVRVVRRMEALAHDVSDNDLKRLSYRQWSLINRAAWLEERLGLEEQKIITGTPGPPGSHSTLLNSLIASYRTMTQVGPKERTMLTLQQYIARQDES